MADFIILSKNYRINFVNLIKLTWYFPPPLILNLAFLPSIASILDSGSEAYVPLSVTMATNVVSAVSASYWKIYFAKYMITWNFIQLHGLLITIGDNWKFLTCNKAVSQVKFQFLFHVGEPWSKNLIYLEPLLKLSGLVKVLKVKMQTNFNPKMSLAFLHL